MTKYCPNCGTTITKEETCPVCGYAGEMSDDREEYLKKAEKMSEKSGESDLLFVKSLISLLTIVFLPIAIFPLIYYSFKIITKENKFKGLIILILGISIAIPSILGYIFLIMSFFAN